MALLLIRSFNRHTKLNVQILRQISSLKCNQFRCFSNEANKSKTIAKSEGKGDVGEAKPLGEKVKETVKTTSYLGVIVIGVGVTAIMFYAIFSELFGSSSPQAVYADAFDKCKDDPRVQDALGYPIKAYGEESRRRRRTHIAHQEYMKEGRKYMRLTFHIQGIRNKATVQCDMRQNDNGKYDYRYLLVQLDNYPHTTIIIEDNRVLDELNAPSSQPQSSSMLKGILN